MLIKYFEFFLIIAISKHIFELLWGLRNCTNILVCPSVFHFAVYLNRISYSTSSERGEIKLYADKIFRVFPNYSYFQAYF